jgi:AmmeMemoRadiSam system protein B
VRNIRCSALSYRQLANKYGTLCAASRFNWMVTRLDLRNSGDTGGDKRQVVGYGAWAFTAVERLVG